MPVSVAIGGDPLLIWCAQAPLPPGIFELLLYGFIRGKHATLVRSLTNEIYVPADADIVIEGYVDPIKTKIEGPFGDHTGYYTLQEPFPLLEVTAITTKKDPLYTATVVGKPPLEDRYMGWATERIFLPLLKPMAPDLIDYHMPENGCFHNLILAKMRVAYPGHAKQFMHAFWGVGQMSFVKHALFVDEDAPSLTDYEALTHYILDRIDASKLLISQGVVDHLDHSSPKQFEGGKLGVDATGSKVEKKISLLSDDELLKRVKALVDEAVVLKQYATSSANPICILSINKVRSAQEVISALAPLKEHIALLVVIDHKNNDTANPYMLVWRVTNNIDAVRDIVLHPFIALDATNKGSVDGYIRQWPEDTHCDKSVLESLHQKGVIEIEEQSIKRFGLLPFH